MKLLNVKEVKGLEKKVEKILKDESMNKTNKMKELFRLGLEVKDISNMMGVRYNFVYNVVSNMILIEGLEVENNKSTSKKDLVRELFNQGKSSKEIARELKTNLNYVYKLIKEIKNESVNTVVEETETK